MGKRYAVKCISSTSWLEIYANLPSPKTPKSISDKVPYRFVTSVTVIEINGIARGSHGPAVLEAKRKEFVNDALIYAKSLCEELVISFKPPRRIRRKHIFGDGSKDVQLSYEGDLRRTQRFLQ
ncbi:uncharacterized protein TNCV_1856791 [Trichonephila clavipes]|nr:uncharacterized protein TNCV_1856791 [Trichonephila clavipes]